MDRAYKRCNNTLHFNPLHKKETALFLFPLLCKYTWFPRPRLSMIFPSPFLLKNKLSDFSSKLILESRCSISDHLFFFSPSSDVCSFFRSFRVLESTREGWSIRQGEPFRSWWGWRRRRRQAGAAEGQRRPVSRRRVRRFVNFMNPWIPDSSISAKKRWIESESIPIHESIQCDSVEKGKKNVVFSVTFNTFFSSLVPRFSSSRLPECIQAKFPDRPC